MSYRLVGWKAPHLPLYCEGTYPDSAGSGWRYRLTAAAERLKGRPRTVEMLGLVKAEGRALANSQMAAQVVVGASQLPGHGEPLGLPNGPHPGPASGAMPALKPVSPTKASERAGPGYRYGAGVAPQAAAISAPSE